jgi:hypothetical protein
MTKLKGEKEKESIISSQRISSLTTQLDLLKKKYDEEVGGMAQEHQQKIEELELEVQMLTEENNLIRSKHIDLERDHNELHSNYERDKALSEDKIAFLENQKNQAKRDLADAHQKFEMTVEQLQRKDSSERGKTESAQMMLINSIEKKYKDQIKDINESHSQVVSDWASRYKLMEKEHKELTQKYQIESRGKISEYSSMETKIRELLDADQVNQEEIKRLKSILDKK